MSADKPEQGFLEDGFDLDEIKNTQRKKILMGRFRKKNQKTVNLLTIIIILFAFAVSYLLYMLAQYYIDLWRKDQLLHKARSITENYRPPGETAAAAEVTPEEHVYTEDAPQPDASGPEIEELPFVRLEDMPLDPEIALLREAFQNEDIVGYLIIPGTNIDFPVVATGDNDFYQAHDLSKSPNIAGSAFMDYENNVISLGYNTIIYAHNMRDGSMFHNLRYYGDSAFYEDHRLIYFQTAYRNTEWEVFSFYETTTDFNYINNRYQNREDFYTRLLSVVREKSAYETGVAVEVSDRILTLSTCTNKEDDSRYVVHARLVSEN